MPYCASVHRSTPARTPPAHPPRLPFTLFGTSDRRPHHYRSTPQFSTNLSWLRPRNLRPPSASSNKPPVRFANLRTTILQSSIQQNLMLSRWLPRVPL